MIAAVVVLVCAAIVWLSHVLLDERESALWIDWTEDEL